ncbi:MAG: hypothetical protein ACREP1_03345 [Rhodanobacteraceae bacterium]
MSEPPRRRRSSGYTPSNGDAGGFPLWPLLIVIVVLGFFIGGVLAHFLGSPKLGTNRAATQATPLSAVYVTPVPSAKPVAVATRVRRAKPSTAPSLAPSREPTAGPSVARTVAPAIAPTVTPTVAPTVVPKPKPVVAPVRPASAPPAPANGAAGVVRDYIAALANGNRTSAGQLLANGSVDQDSFIDASARITNLQTIRNADGTSRVNVDLQTASGTYEMTFIVSGSRIIDHTATIQ